MSMMIREYLGYDKFDVEFNYSESMQLTESMMSSEPISPNSLMVDIEGIHVGPTRNFTRYMESALKSSKRSWTVPYEKPLIMHHNEKDGKIIGRIKAVEYTDKKTRSGTGALIFTTNVPDKEGMEQIEDGRLSTVSIGIIGHDVRCSICNHNIAEYGECDHERGSVYDGQICYWDIYEMEGKELSYVIVPSDIYAKNIRIYKPTNKTHISEGMNLKEGVDDLKLTEAEIKQMQEELEGLKEEKKQFDSIKEGLENDLKEAEKKVEEMKIFEEEKEALAKEKGELEEKLKEAEKKLEDAEKELGEAKEKLQDAIGEVKKEKELRESLESKSIELNSATKQALVENYAILRKLAGKPDISMESIKERSQESLHDAIKDLKEEMGDSIDTMTIQRVVNPTITESADPIVKKEEKPSNIDLEEGLQSLFDSVASNFTNK